jgi:adenylyltransferase/sulfurtransferase
MDIHQFKALLENKDDSIAIVDVRSLEEWNEFHLENTLHIPLDEILFAKETLTAYKKIVFLCAHGSRAARASAAYESLGFTNVDYVTGSLSSIYKDRIST